MTTPLLEKFKREGTLHKIPKGQVFHSLDFKDEFYVLKKGYVKRSSIRRIDARSVQAIYGPTYFFPLTPVFKIAFDLTLGEEGSSYFYEAMTDIEVYVMERKKMAELMEADQTLYSDLLYESGRRLKSNIHNLENNVWKEPVHKLAYHLVYLANEFGRLEQNGTFGRRVRIQVPLSVRDLSEQLDITEAEIAAEQKKLVKRNLIEVKGEIITIVSLEMLKDIYLEK